MSKGVKFVLLTVVVIAVAILGAVVFVTPQRALSAAIMRDCIDVVKEKVRGFGAISIVSVAVIQPDSNKRKFDDFSRATQAVISRGDMKPSEPNVLVDFETSRGAGKALCTYHADLWTKSGTYSGVSANDVQIDLNSLSNLEMAFMKRFDVGRLDRVFSLFPILGTKQKFLLN
jgi:hypothetical protein